MTAEQCTATFTPSGAPRSDEVSAEVFWPASRCVKLQGHTDCHQERGNGHRWFDARSGYLTSNVNVDGICDTVSRPVGGSVNVTLNISDTKNYLPVNNHDLSNRFTYHAPSKGEVELYEQIRAEGHGMAQFIRDNTPPSPEQYEAIKSIELAVMWANAAQARHGDGGA